MAVTIDGFAIDVTVSEEHGDRYEVTQHPVEDGADVSDHVRIFPAQITLTGIVSDTPIAPVAGIRDVLSIPSNDAYAKLRSIGRKVVTVVTALRTYENMTISDLSVPRDSNTGKALRFRATFQQIRLVENERATVPVAVPRAAKGSVNRGSKPTKAATPPSTAYEAGSIYWNKVQQKGAGL